MVPRPTKASTAKGKSKTTSKKRARSPSTEPLSDEEPIKKAQKSTKATRKNTRRKNIEHEEVKEESNDSDVQVIKSSDDDHFRQHHRGGLRSQLRPNDLGAPMGAPSASSAQDQ
ncbi:hypothetical protein H0H92_003270 [Tricholoma furcatifolium]|nr:hypothetical protein H0H92_003270 [Tricholoma furcatifolium]